MESRESLVQCDTGQITSVVWGAVTYASSAVSPPCPTLSTPSTSNRRERAATAATAGESEPTSGCELDLRDM